VDTRLFMPEPWWSTNSATRRATCQVPKALTLQTKPQLAVEMLRLLAGEDVLPFTYVVPDCLQGKSPAFLAAVASYVTLTFGVAIPADTRCRTQGWFWRRGRLTKEVRVVPDVRRPPKTVRGYPSTARGQ
jgi:SRSO17 transposase